MHTAMKARYPFVRLTRNLVSLLNPHQGENEALIDYLEMFQPTLNTVTQVHPLVFHTNRGAIRYSTTIRSEISTVSYLLNILDVKSGAKMYNCHVGSMFGIPLARRSLEV